MRRTFADLVAWGKQYLRTPTASFFTLVFPVLLILVFGGVFGAPEEINIQLHVQDLDNSSMSTGVVEALDETAVITVITVPEREDLETYVRDQSISVALRIPSGFEGDVLSAASGNPDVHPKVELLGDTSSSTFQTVQGVVQGVVTGLVFELYGATPVSVESKGIAQQSFSYLDFFLPGVIGISILTPLFAVSATAAEYRERHYFKLLATTPLRKGEYLLSRTLWMIGLVFVSTLLMILIARLVFGAVFVLNPIAAALIVAGTVLFVSIGMAIGNFAKTVEGASAVANVIYFPMMFLTGTFFPVEIMPGFIQAISRALPLTYFNNGLRDTLVFGNVSNALTNLGIISVLAVVFFVLASWSLSWKAE